ncbi:MAG: Planctomycete cytochrome [Planctomycetota bacterium]|nr:Planctomycete cytochrome [Planctomycetota bacterium]
MTLLLCAFLFAVLSEPGSQPDSRPVDFSREVRPILASYCIRCHGPDEKARKGGLRLDDREAAIRTLSGGNRAIVPGKPGDSEILERLTTDDVNSVMPPRKLGKRPSPREVEILEQWIAQGARYTTHWAYAPPVRAPSPAVSDPSWPRNPIDHFVLARLDREKLRPSPAADRHTLLRRAALDLTGLPPSSEEADRFINDAAPDAYERAVDALLKKPSYGERWAAMWLDLARYGDSQGYIHDPPRTIWRWRDWLIQALNDNLPYDRFTTEMLAGDLLPGATPAQVVATGFHRNTTNNTEGGANGEEYRHASVVDRVNTTMQAWMGTSLACAQCHNHKYDPFTQKEYYQIFSVFNSTADANGEDPTIEVPRMGQEAAYAGLSAQFARAKQKLDEESQWVDSRRGDWEKAVDRARLPKDLADILAVPAEKRTKAQADALAAHHRSTHPDWSGRDADVRRLRAELDGVSTTTLVMKEIAPRPTAVAIRGEYQSRGEPVTPGVPAALHPAPSGVKLDRLGLAKWIVDPSNPLTARVAVNRLWQEIFGVGLVETSEEFGTQGEPPSHPELLDWLATEYVRLGWDTKQLLKVIVTSAAYRQSSVVGDASYQVDPMNRLLARGPRSRLSAEALRDQALFVSGLLSAKPFGPPVHPYQPLNGLAAAFGPSTDWETSKGEDAHRRALYTRWRRNLPYPSMIAFDVPERAVCSMRRIRTNTPIQALVTLNDPVFIEAAQALARRILTEGGATLESRAAFGVRLVLSRPASEAETHRLAALFQASRSSLAADPARASALATRPLGPVPAGMDVLDAAAWTVVGNVLLNLDETLAKR